MGCVPSLQALEVPREDGTAGPELQFREAGLGVAGAPPGELPCQPEGGKGEALAARAARRSERPPACPRPRPVVGSPRMGLHVKEITIPTTMLRGHEHLLPWECHTWDSLLGGGWPGPGVRRALLQDRPGEPPAPGAAWWAWWMRRDRLPGGQPGHGHRSGGWAWRVRGRWGTSLDSTGPAPTQHRRACMSYRL